MKAKKNRFVWPGRLFVTTSEAVSNSAQVGKQVEKVLDGRCRLRHTDAKEQLRGLFHIRRETRHSASLTQPMAGSDCPLHDGMASGPVTTRDRDCSQSRLSLHEVTRQPTPGAMNESRR